MKRSFMHSLLPFAIPLAFGAATTIAVAWSCAAWPVPNFRAIKRSVGFDRDRNESAGEGRGYLTLHGTYEFGTLSLYAVASQQGVNGTFYNYNPSNSTSDVPSRLIRAAQPWRFGDLPWPPNGVADQRYIAAAGWPLLALYSVSGDRSDASRSTPHSGIHTPYWFYSDSMQQGPRLYYLPVTPLFPGFAADSALFGLPWFLVFFAPRMIRRALRLRRGHCPRCNYDRHGLASGAVCPECGSCDPT